MSTGESNSPESTSIDSERDQQWQHIKDALRGLRYGAVNIIVQDGVIVQIDRTEKRRVRGAEAR